MTELTAWLLERIAEDEAVVAEAGAPLGRVDSELVECDTYAYRYHIAASRVLAECSARRKIVEAVSAWIQRLCNQSRSVPPTCPTPSGLGVRDE